jgi:hypothetical protein
MEWTNQIGGLWVSIILYVPRIQQSDWSLAMGYFLLPPQYSTLLRIICCAMFPL